MRSWINDLSRLPWALVLWNVRKSFFVLRGRTGSCPCHNPSDSGEAGRTGCEAVVGWSEPARFRRVCPLLVRTAAGAWVCGVAADRVRPFWGRALTFAGIVALVLALGVGGVTYALMRTVGYRVTMRQVFWPPAWGELRAVRAELFIAQARAFYAQGRVREVVQALATAQVVDPANVEARLLLAQVSEVGNPAFADILYERVLEEDSAHAAEIARRWLRSLLARGRLRQVASLARGQLAGAGAADAAGWTHALVFAAQHLREPVWLEEAVKDPAVPEGARATLMLAARLLRTPDAAGRVAALRQTPLDHGFPYGRVWRIEQLLREGRSGDALELLAVSRRELGDRDVARLALAGYVVAGDEARVTREFGALLAPGRPLAAAELALLALHLVQYPSAERLGQVVAAMARIRTAPAAQQVEAYMAVFCAAGVQKEAGQLKAAHLALAAVAGDELRPLKRVEAFFLQTVPRVGGGRVLPPLQPLSMELAYALVDRYFVSESSPNSSGPGR